METFWFKLITTITVHGACPEESKGHTLVRFVHYCPIKNVIPQRSEGNP